MMPSEIALALDGMRGDGRLDEWFVFDSGADGQREWFITPPGGHTIQYTRREVEAFLLGASLY